MPFRLAISVAAKADLKSLRAYDRQRVGEQIDKQLTTEPFVETRNRKRLRMEEGVLPFEHVLPAWELRVGKWRVYYDGEGADEQVVYVRAVREKPPHRTTEDSLREDRDD